MDTTSNLRDGEENKTQNLINDLMKEFKSNKDINYVKDTMIDLFNEYLLYQIMDPDDILYEMYEDIGNYSILYSIRKVDFYKE